MQTIVIIGAGNIGSRHLQAFGISNMKLQIIVIDPFKASLDVCEGRWKEVSKENSTVEVKFQKDYSNIPKQIDFAIISTNSEHRFKALNDLLSNCECKNILLEKFLFSTEKEYADATTIIEQHKTKAYVNLVRRTFECYQWVSKELSSEKGNMTMKVVGNNWGMASNCIHFIDLFCYLANDSIATCEFSNPESTKIIESKREGYVEFLGTVSAHSKLGSKLIVECNEGTYDKINITIEKGGFKMNIDEIGETITVNGDSPAGEAGKKFPYPYQSQLTAKYFIELTEGRSSLPTYNEAANSHLKFLSAVKNILLHKNYKQAWKIT